MANTRSGNIWYVDTAHSSGTDDLAVGCAVTAVVLTATSANAIIVLQDRVTSDKKLDLRVATSGSTVVFPFADFPVSFPNGIKVSTLTNAVATLIGR